MPDVSTVEDVRKPLAFLAGNLSRRAYVDGSVGTKPTKGPHDAVST